VRICERILNITCIYF